MNRIRTVLGIAGWVLWGITWLALLDTRRIAGQALAWLTQTRTYLCEYMEVAHAEREMLGQEAARSWTASVNNRRVYQNLLDYYSKMYPGYIEEKWLYAEDVTAEMVGEGPVAVGLERVLQETQTHHKQLPPHKDYTMRMP